MTSDNRKLKETSEQQNVSFSNNKSIPTVRSLFTVLPRFHNIMSHKANRCSLSFLGRQDDLFIWDFVCMDRYNCIKSLFAEHNS